MKHILPSAITFLACCTYAATAYSKCNWKTEVRNSFDTTDKQSQAARFAMLHRAGDDDFTILDVAAKIGECEWTQGNFISPVVEYHNDSSVAKPVEFYSIGLTGNSELPDLFLKNDKLEFSPYLDFGLTYKDDKQTQVETGKATLQLSGQFADSLKFSENFPRALLGAFGRKRDDYDLWILAPSIALEKYWSKPLIIDNAVSEIEKDDPVYALIRYHANVWVHRFSGGNGVQLFLTGEYRDIVDGDGLSSPKSITTGVNVTFDKEGNISIGLDYQHGNDTNIDFLDDEKTVLSLKVKI